MTDRIIALCILCLVFGLPLGVAAVFTGELILDFVFFWPLFMSVLWITGCLYFLFQLERHWPWGEDTPPPTLPGLPEANSSPSRPCCCAKPASFASDTPASA